VVWASVPAAIALVFWFWPRREENAQDLALEKAP
jgi:cytochrome c oxidase subunit 1